jgi:hypothetical protein
MRNEARKLQEMAYSPREQFAPSSGIAVRIGRISVMELDNDAQVSRTVRPPAELSRRAQALGTIGRRCRV